MPGSKQTRHTQTRSSSARSTSNRSGTSRNTSSRGSQTRHTSPNSRSSRNHSTRTSSPKNHSGRSRSTRFLHTNYDDWIDQHFTDFMNSPRKKDIKRSTSLKVDFIELSYVDSSYHDSVYTHLQQGYILYKPLFSRRVDLFLYKGHRAKLQVEGAIALKIIFQVLSLLLALSIPIALILFIR